MLAGPDKRRTYIPAVRATQKGKTRLSVNHRAILPSRTCGSTRAGVFDVMLIDRHQLRSMAPSWCSRDYRCNQIKF